MIVSFLQKYPIRCVGLLSLIFSLFVFIPSGSVFASDGNFAGGSGGSGSPYQIEDCADLQAILGNMSAYYVLNNDIDCSGFSFTQLGPYFTGSLDGQGYVVKNVSMSGLYSSYLGLFYVIDEGGVVKNLGLVDFDIEGSAYAGTLAGRVAGDVEKVYATGGSVTCGGYCGGLSGILEGGNVSSSYSNVEVNIEPGPAYAGGLFGASDGGNIYNSFAVGPINNAWSGGIFGVVSDPYEPFNITTTTVSHVYYDTQTIGATGAQHLGDDTYGSGRTTSQMMTQTTFTGFDFNVEGGGTIGDWIMAGYPHLQMEHRSTITTAVELQLINVDLTDDYTLGADIDCNCSNWNDGEGFSAIDSGSYYFSGTLDGQGHKISNLYIDGPTNQFLGLFAYMSGAVAHDLYLVNVDITHVSSVGGLAGEAHNSIVTNIYVSGSIDDAGYCSGMLIGGSYGTDVYRSYSTGIITTLSTGAGGLVGINEGDIYDSYSSADISANSYAGGLVGDNSSGNIYRSYAIGPVTTSDPDTTGGLVGYIYEEGTGTVTDSFYDSETSGLSDTGKGTGKTTVEMKDVATFTDTNTVGLA